MKRSHLVYGVAVLALVGCSEREAVSPVEFEAVFAAAGAAGQNFNTHMTGDEEVPARETKAQGQAHFQFNRAGTEVSYWLNVANIENVVAAHIHVGPAGTNGPVVVLLYGPQPAAGGRIQGRIATGTFTAGDLAGPLAGASLSDLRDAMRAGNTYVNVHTNDGVPPTNTGPGDFPGGEIRGQIVARGPHG
jgi:hypothetical protein